MFGGRYGGLFFDVFMYLKCEISFPNCLTIWYNRNGLMKGQWERENDKSCRIRYV